jgi:hypothetical protein
LVTWWLVDSWLSGGWLILGDLFSWWLLDFLMILGCVVASCFWVNSWSHVGSLILGGVGGGCLIFSCSG